MWTEFELGGYRMTREEAAKRIEYLKFKAEVVLANSNTESVWLKAGVEATITALTMAVEALEKQIPKKPVNYDSVPHSRCPVCNNAVKVFEDAHKHHYCLYCGQRLDWEEEDEA